VFQIHPPLPTKNLWLAFLFGALFLLFPIAAALSNVVLLLILITWLVTLKGQGYGDIFKSTPVLWFLSALYFVVLLGVTFTSSEWKWTSLHLSKYARFFYAIVIIFLLTRREHIQKYAFNGFVMAMMITLSSTWLNIWFVLPWSESKVIGWGQSHHVFGDYITQNVMMAFFTVIATHKSFQSPNTSLRVFWGITALLAAISITHLSEGRTGYILLVAGLISYALTMAKGKWLIASLTGIVLAATVALSPSSILKSRFTQAFEEARNHEVDNMSSIGHRLYNYKITPQLIAEKPLFGHGTGAYHTEICRFVGKPDWCPIFSWHPHNQFLFLGADHGLIGIGLYVLLILSLYRTALKSQRLDAKVLLSALATILLIDSLINTPFWSSRESQFFAYLIGLLVSMSQQSPSPRNSIQA